MKNTTVDHLATTKSPIKNQDGSDCLSSRLNVKDPFLPSILSSHSEFQILECIASFNLGIGYWLSPEFFLTIPQRTLTRRVGNPWIWHLKSDIYAEQVLLWLYTPSWCTHDQGNNRSTQILFKWIGKVLEVRKALYLKEWLLSIVNNSIQILFDKNGYKLPSNFV